MSTSVHRCGATNMAVLLFSLLALVVFHSSGEVISDSKSPGVPTNHSYLRLGLDILEWSCPHLMKDVLNLKAKLVNSALITENQKVEVEREVYMDQKALLDKCQGRQGDFSSS